MQGDDAALLCIFSWLAKQAAQTEKETVFKDNLLCICYKY